MSCIICLDLCKNSVKISCGHIFCKDCIINWSKKSDKCPICRLNFNLEITHTYNTRQNFHIMNKEIIMNKMKEFLDDYNWICLEREEKIIKFNEIYKYIYDNKYLLKNIKFKKAVLEKIEYLKNEDEFIGYYWSQKIY